MGKFVKGQSGNPAGRPIGSRQRVAEKLIADLATIWEEEGETILRRLALTEPAKLATIAYGLLPREAFLHVQHSGAALDAAEQEMMHEVLQAVSAAVPNAGAREPGEVLQLVLDALRMHTARPLLVHTSDNQSEGHGS
jgi:hypothetical protein